MSKFIILVVIFLSFNLFGNYKYTTQEERDYIFSNAVKHIHYTNGHFYLCDDYLVSTNSDTGYHYLANRLGKRELAKKIGKRFVDDVTPRLGRKGFYSIDTLSSISQYPRENGKFIIRYYYEGYSPSYFRKMVNRAMSDWEAIAPVKFKKVSGDWEDPFTSRFKITFNNGDDNDCTTSDGGSYTGRATIGSKFLGSEMTICRNYFEKYRYMYDITIAGEKTNTNSIYSRGGLYRDKDGKDHFLTNFIKHLGGDYPPNDILRLPFVKEVVITNKREVDKSGYLLSFNGNNSILKSYGPLKETVITTNKITERYINYFLTTNWLVKTIRHELGHIIGLYHEHERWDRDDYVVVNKDYKKYTERIYYKGEEKEFKIFGVVLFSWTEGEGEYGFGIDRTKYDYHSIMNYILKVKNPFSYSNDTLNKFAELNVGVHPKAWDWEDLAILIITPSDAKAVTDLYDRQRYSREKEGKKKFHWPWENDYDD